MGGVCAIDYYKAVQTHTQVSFFPQDSPAPSQHIMYCIQAFLPLFLFPRPLQTSPTQALFVVLFIVSMYLDHRPCAVCTVSLLFALVLAYNLGPEHSWLNLFQPWPAQLPKAQIISIDVPFAL